MYDYPYDRKFGIEFEFNMPGLVAEIDDYGYRTKIGALKTILKENGMGTWSIGSDGSEFEVRTPILSGPNGLKTVKNFLEVIKSYGGQVHNRYDGLHVHHDAPEFRYNKELVINLVENWMENQYEINKMVQSSRVTNSACRQWDSETFNLLKDTPGRDGYWGRRNLNISSLNRHGTIEFRMHEGTLDYEHVFSWVRFGQAFIGKVVENGGAIFDRATSPSDLLKKINVSRNASRFIASKVQNNYGSVWA